MMKGSSIEVFGNGTKCIFVDVYIMHAHTLSMNLSIKYTLNNVYFACTTMQYLCVKAFSKGRSIWYGDMTSSHDYSTSRSLHCPLPPTTLTFSRTPFP
jgi:hypothetical protein